MKQLHNAFMDNFIGQLERTTPQSREPTITTVKGQQFEGFNWLYFLFWNQATL